MNSVAIPTTGVEQATRETLVEEIKRLSAELATVTQEREQYRRAIAHLIPLPEPMTPEEIAEAGQPVLYGGVSRRAK
jgi:hypothetical protein